MSRRRVIYTFFECSPNITSGLLVCKPLKLVVYCFYINNSGDVQFFHEFTGTINHSWLTNQSTCMHWFGYIKVFNRIMMICMMASFDHNYQNPPIFLFLMLIRAIVKFKPHWGSKNEVNSGVCSHMTLLCKSLITLPSRPWHLQNFLPSSE